MSGARDYEVYNKLAQYRDPAHLQCCICGITSHDVYDYDGHACHVSCHALLDVFLKEEEGFVQYVKTYDRTKDPRGLKRIQDPRLKYRVRGKDAEEGKRVDKNNTVVEHDDVVLYNGVYAYKQPEDFTLYIDYEEYARLVAKPGMVVSMSNTDFFDISAIAVDDEFFSNGQLAEIIEVPTDALIYFGLRFFTPPIYMLNRLKNAGIDVEEYLKLSYEDVLTVDSGLLTSRWHSRHFRLIG
jgi:hypothetical protein